MLQVAAGIIARRGHLLVCQRAPGGAHPLEWEFPGGKCEPGETPAQCLRRELGEELAIDAQIGAELWRASHAYAGQSPIELVFLRVAAFTGALVNRAFADIRWVPLGDLEGLDFLAGDRAVVRALASGQLTCGEVVADSTAVTPT